MWVEVKELDPPVSQTQIDIAYRELSQRLTKLKLPVVLDCWVGPGFDHRVGKIAMHLVHLGLRKYSADVTSWYVCIPRGNYQADCVDFIWRDRKGMKVHTISAKLTTGLYGVPLAAGPGNWIANVDVTSAGVIRSCAAYKILSEVETCRLVLRVERSLESARISSVGSGIFNNVATVQQIRNAVDDAAKQLDSGQNARKAPGVVEVYNDAFGATPDELLRACLGDLTIPIYRPSLTRGNPMYGNNGILRGRKNRSVSAVTYRSRHCQAISVVHPEPMYPVRLNWLDGDVYYVDGDGSVVRAH